jgi:hypothetical protein
MNHEDQTELRHSFFDPLRSTIMTYQSFILGEQDGHPGIDLAHGQRNQHFVGVRTRRQMAQEDDDARM